MTKQCPNHKPDVSLVLLNDLIYTCALQRSPLLLAAMHGHERVVEILLKQDNVDVNAKNTTTGYNCL